MTKFLLLAALVSTSALAQDAVTSEAPPPPPPAEAAPMATAPMDAPMAATEEDPGGRVRWGISGNLGWHLPSPAFTIGAEGRIGWQLSRMFGAYAVLGYTAGLGFGVDAGIQGASVSITALGYYYFGAIAELLLADIFYAGGGLVLANGGYVGAAVGATSNGTAQVSQFASAGWKPAIDLRFGLALGSKKPAPSFRKGGFTLGIDALILFHPNTTIVTVAADGPNGTAGASVTTTGMVVSVVPMLMIGYDAR